MFADVGGGVVEEVAFQSETLLDELGGILLDSGGRTIGHGENVREERTENNLEVEAGMFEERTSQRGKGSGAGLGKLLDIFRLKYKQ